MEWKRNVISGKQTDSVQKETLAVFATEVIVDKTSTIVPPNLSQNKNYRPLLVHKRRHRLTEESFRKALAPGEKVLQEGKVRKRAISTSMESVRIRRVSVWHDEW